MREAPRIHPCPRHPRQLCVVGWPCEVCVWFETGQHRATPFARWLDEGLTAERRAQQRREARRRQP